MDATPSWPGGGLKPPVGVRVQGWAAPLASVRAMADSEGRAEVKGIDGDMLQPPGRAAYSVEGHAEGMTMPSAGMPVGASP